jgi:Tfp pilus assembly protein PilO
MMGLRRDRLWLIAGLLAAAVLFAVGWFTVIHPQRSQTETLREQSAAAELNLASLRHRLEDLEEQNANLDQYRAELARERRALPTTPALADFLRELQSAGDAVQVTVTGLIVGSPTEVDAAGTKVISLPITLTLSGTASRLGQFLDQLQRVQPRAVLITSANALPDQKSKTLAGAVALNISLQAFIAPATG